MMDTKKWFTKKSKTPLTFQISRLNTQKDSKQIHTIFRQKQLLSMTVTKISKIIVNLITVSHF